MLPVLGAADSRASYCDLEGISFAQISHKRSRAAGKV